LLRLTHIVPRGWGNEVTGIANYKPEPGKSPPVRSPLGRDGSNWLTRMAPAPAFGHRALPGSLWFAGLDGKIGSASGYGSRLKWSLEMAAEGLRSSHVSMSYDAAIQ